MHVTYVRHGSIHRGSPGDLPLSADGRREASATARFIGRCPESGPVWSSPLRRALETATEIAGSLGVEVQVDDRLRERMNFGDLVGQSFEEFVAMWERCDAQREYVPHPSGQSARMSGEALDSALGCLRDSGLPRVVVVSHGGILTDFLRNCATDGRLAILPEVSNLPNCSITRFLLSAESIEIESWANTEHLIALD